MAKNVSPVLVTGEVSIAGASSEGGGIPVTISGSDGSGTVPVTPAGYSDQRGGYTTLTSSSTAKNVTVGFQAEFISVWNPGPVTVWVAVGVPAAKPADGVASSSVPVRPQTRCLIPRRFSTITGQLSFILDSGAGPQEVFWMAGGNEQAGYGVDGINLALLPETRVTTSYANYDDGALRRGLKPSGARFTLNKEGTITDNVTGLIWVRHLASVHPGLVMDVSTIEPKWAQAVVGGVAYRRGDVIYRATPAKSYVCITDYTAPAQSPEQPEDSANWAESTWAGVKHTSYNPPSGTLMLWVPRRTFAEACAAINAINSGGGFANATDWRLPNVIEVATLINFESSAVSAFPATGFDIKPNLFHYWTSSKSSAWGVANQATVFNVQANQLNAQLISRSVNAGSDEPPNGDLGFALGTMMVRGPYVG